MSKIEVDAIEPQSGTTLTIGASGDTIALGSGASFTAPTITRLTTGTGTYTTPSGVKYIIVEMVGGGGGGSGGGLASIGAGGNAGNTTFGTSLHTTSGGNGGSVPWGAGGTGGSVTLGAGGTAIVFSCWL
jgi:hypothetical protein